MWSYKSVLYRVFFNLAFSVIIGQDIFFARSSENPGKF